MKKRIFSLLLCLLMAISLCSGMTAATENDISKFELPKPAAPVYMKYDAADRTATEGNDALYVVRQSDMSVVTLSAEESSDRDAFLEKYGLYDFMILMQYDTSLDGADNWNYTPEWDTDYAAMTAYEANSIAWISGDLMETETLFDLYSKEPDNDNYSNMADAMIHRPVDDENGYTFHNYYFDHENHSLSVRCRYYMQWEVNTGEDTERYTKVSEWSDAAVFGKGGNTVIPEEPTGYAAPIISDLKYVQPMEGSEHGSLTYVLTTPQSVWDAAIYYELTDSGSFYGLETEISVDDSDWQPYDTVNSWADWGLSAGIRTAQSETPRIEADSKVQLRVRYTGDHGPSEWSNVIAVNDGGTQVVPEDTSSTTEEEPAPPVKEPEEKKCGICGFCPEPFGICLFILIAIVLAVILILVIVIVIATRPKKCKHCKTKLKKGAKFYKECGKPVTK